MTAPLADALVDHLHRKDGQEDLCFAIWMPSRGHARMTALLRNWVAPVDGDRDVHGNVAFNPPYFVRALGRAMEAGGGLAFLHSHPGGRGWQALSDDDRRAEMGMAGAALSATGLPLLGLTLGTGDMGWSARLWDRRLGPRRYQPTHCTSVRVLGDRFFVSFNPKLMPVPPAGDQIVRTVSAWGTRVQADIGRLRVCVAGLGSVGSIVAEALARVGVRHVTLLDFDSLEQHNLDRTLHAAKVDAKKARAKVDIAAKAYRRSAPIGPVHVEAHELSICEHKGFRRALDCDLIFSCVDRPWARSVLNFIAYAHLIPVVDGGIHVSRKPDGAMRGADWKAHIATIGRRCLECLGQYDPGLVAGERDGILDDPRYMETLPGDHPVRSRENVFPFSLAAASLEVLQMLQMIVAPAGVGNCGAQNYHLVTGQVDLDNRGCEPHCPFPPLAALGEAAGDPGTVVQHTVAARARTNRRGPSSQTTDPPNA